MKMTLKEDRNNILKIEKIYKQRKSNITEIQIIDIETNKTVNPTIYKPKKVSRFELMDI